MTKPVQSYENQFHTDVLTHPGVSLREYIEDAGMTISEFTKRTGWTEQHVHKILNGRSRISTEFALMLEKVFRVPAWFWNSMQNQYDEFTAQQKENEVFAQSLDWARAFPYSELVKKGWLPDVNRKASDKLEQLLRFFRVGNPSAFESFWEDRMPTFRASAKLPTNRLALACWIRQAEIKAEQAELPVYDRSRFLEVLEEIRDHVSEDLVEYQTTMKTLCSEAGVLLLFQPHLTGMAIGGVTFWNKSKSMPVIVLSLRWNSDDHIWFNFFHEAKHVLQAMKKRLFVDDPRDAVDDPKEIEANHYAASKLIDPNRLRCFIDSNTSLGADSISQFAKNENVTPGIVLGQLQHIRVIPFDSHLNKTLKKRFVFE